MRKLMLLAVGMAFALVIVSGVAFAKTFQCTDANCYGTNNPDQITERQGNSKTDDIYARRGADVVNAARFDNDTDVLRGQAGPDRLRSDDNDGQDVIICGDGNDVAVVSDGDTVTDGCEDIRGGTPSDVVSEQEGLALAAAL
jgi:hypothetical protein